MTPEQAQSVLNEYRARMRDAATRWRENHRHEHDMWTVETVKHLAFVNAAGLAGAAALYASEAMSKKAVVFCKIPSALFFAIGLAMAVLDMYLNSLGALARMKEVDRRLGAWDQNQNGGQNEAMALLAAIEPGQRCFNWARNAGWASVISFGIGAYPFALLSF